MCSHLSLTPVSEAYKGYMFQLRKRSTLGQYRKDYKVEAQKERKEKKREKKKEKKKRVQYVLTYYSHP